MKRFKRIFRHKLTRQHIILAVLAVVVVYVAGATLHVIAQNYRLQQRINELQAQNQVLELENQQLRYRITYYKTDAFVEKEARAKLNLQAPEETTVIFPDNMPGSAQPPRPEPDPGFTESILGNLGQWSHFLFHVRS